MNEEYEIIQIVPILNKIYGILEYPENKMYDMCEIIYIEIRKYDTGIERCFIYIDEKGKLNSIEEDEHFIGYSENIQNAECRFIHLMTYERY